MNKIALFISKFDYAKLRRRLLVATRYILTALVFDVSSIRCVNPMYRLRDKPVIFALSVYTRLRTPKPSDVIIL